MKVFITGDRSHRMKEATAVTVIRALGEGATIITGDNRGVESYVRTLADAAGLVVDVVPTPQGENDRADWDARHRALLEDDDVRILVIHESPWASRIANSVATVAAQTA